MLERIVIGIFRDVGFGKVRPPGISFKQEHGRHEQNRETSHRAKDNYAEVHASIKAFPVPKEVAEMV